MGKVIQEFKKESKSTIKSNGHKDSPLRASLFDIIKAKDNTIKRAPALTKRKLK